ncbi:ABC transporter ATP-binding protein [Spiroplasma helicoides]|uniref:ABC transporter ATP-binding protein n=1 Tax=Spiroplasma helicoides TaxID=216938 RepID=A0A1B3SL49_9MOLU|nr:ATP-binding cassette domain-containing protein [Spiroplasma helicoides]AOG60661.1 ABC transporter ATP-binding protein [Spiroplasma helicoides]
MDVKKELLVELENVSKIFNQKIWAIKKINLKIYKGEGMAIIGPNQSGKTVLGRLIANQIPQTSGIIEYNFTKDDALSSIGFQFRQTTWPDGFTVKDIVELYKGIYNIRDQEWLDNLSNVFDINSRWKRRLESCATSWLQLFSLYLAFLHKPELVVLDEVSSTIGLDMRTRVINFLKNYKEQHNATYVIVSPDKSIFTELCDRILVMESGLILSDDHISCEDTNFDYDDYCLKILSSIETKEAKLKPDPVFRPILKKFESKMEKVNTSYEKLKSKEEVLDFFEIDETLISIRNSSFFLQELYSKLLYLASNALNKSSIDDVREATKTLLIKIKHLNKIYKKVKNTHNYKKDIQKYLQKINDFKIYLKKDFLPIFKSNKIIISGNELTVDLSEEEITKLRFLKKKYIQEELRIMKLEQRILKRQQKSKVDNLTKENDPKGIKLEKELAHQLEIEMEKQIEKDIEKTIDD